MLVDSHNTEMGYEGIATLPYAYALNLQGKLTGTRSGVGSEPFYFFSPDHQINPAPRDFANTAAAAKDIPNMWIHKGVLDKSSWVPPPYKEYYAKDAIIFYKPTVVIYNRYNKEWDRPPINYFDLKTLRSLFTMLLPQYDIVYFNVRGQEALEDNAHSMELGDYEMIAREFPQVHVIHDLVKEHGQDYNTVQLRVFAGCQRFITMNGFPSILASYFGGENVIYTKECKELRPTVNSFYNWYPDFGGSVIKVVHSYDALLKIVQAKWVDCNPLVNILVRCHRRENGMKRLMQSIESQNYVNWNVIASYDEQDAWRYLCPMPIRKVFVRPIEKPEERPMGEEYKAFLAPNLYLNELASHVTGGIITYMDDDDYYLPGALSAIATMGPQELLLWRTSIDGKRPVPSDENWGKIVAGDISGIAFAYHSSNKDLVNWTPWRRGDYRVIKKLSEELRPIWRNVHLSVIGKNIHDRGTPGYMEYRQAEAKRRADEINAAVAQKMIEIKAAEAVKQRAKRPPRPHVCPTCGQVVRT